MGTPLQAVLQIRYMSPGPNVGTKTYGEAGGSPTTPCVDLDKIEGPNAGVLDGSRTHILYFTSEFTLGGTGMNSPAESSNINKQAINRGVNFLNDAYALVGDRIYKYSLESGVWAQSLALTGKDNSRTNSLGLYPVFVNNVPTLITAWNTTGSSWRSASLNGDTDVWTVSSEKGGIINPVDADGGILNEHQHGTKIYFIGSDTNSIAWYDYYDDNFGTITWSTTVRHPMDFCTFGRDLYCLNKDASSNVRIYRITLSSTSLVRTFTRTAQTPPVPDIGSTLTTANNFEGRPLLFVDNVFDSGNPTMYAQYVVNGTGPKFVLDDTNHGLGVEYYQHNTNGTISIKAPSNPTVGAYQANPVKMMTNQAGLLQEGRGETRKGEGMILRCFVDQKNRDVDLSDSTNISVASRFSTFCQAGNGGGGDFGILWYHQFDGSGTAPAFSELLRADGQSSSFGTLAFPAKQCRHRSLVHEKLGGGARYFELNVNAQKLPDIVYRGLESTVQDGVVRIKYELKTSLDAPSGTNVNVRWFYDDNLHSPERRCTLTKTSVGSISGNNIAIGIPIEDKEYFVDWDAKSDGAMRNVRVHLNGQVSTALSAFTAINAPTDLPGLTLWLEANDETTISSGINGTVSQWDDKSSAALISGVLQSVPAAKPIYIPDSNNGNAGIEFTRASGQFMFASGSAINEGLMTLIAIYDTNSSVGRGTLASFANDTDFNPVGTDNYHTMFTSGNENSIGVETQSTGLAPRTLARISGSLSGAKVAIWRDVAFNARLQFIPSGTEVEIFETGNGVEPSGLSNTSIGRFSGAINSGIYPNAADHFDGIIYEVVGYNRELFDVEIDRFKLYAQAKYNLNL